MAIHEATESPSGLALLRSRIRAARIPAARNNLRIATWNIRRFGEGTRFDESIEMIAAIIRSFDVVAIVELCEDLTDLRRTLKVLGPKWRAVFSDYLRDAGGNRERIGILFDSSRVEFTGLASCAEGARARRGTGYSQSVPWWRPPFVASFSGNGRDFALVAAHVRWGASARARSSELAALANWIVERSREPHFGGGGVIVVGDFNATSAAVMAPLFEFGLQLPRALTREVTTDLGHRKRYDQIATLQSSGLRFSDRAGAVDFYVNSHRELFPRQRLTKQAFTFQLSDHLPLWAEIL